jgi:phosphate starvation-inducible protein PhoH
LQKVNDIGFIEFTEKDVVRNPLVSKIVTEYEKFERDQGVGKKYLIKRKKNSDD